LTPIQVDIEETIKTIGVIGGIVIGIAGIWKKFIKPMICQLQYLQEMMHKLDGISAELASNGGASLRDAINRIESRQVMSDQRWLAYLLDSESGTWEADTEGKTIAWNRTLEQLLGIAPKGYSWINCIAPEDKERVMLRWKESVRLQVEFDLIFKIVRNGEILKLRARAYPLLSKQNEVDGWFGTVRKLVTQ
jgi:PAS domain S-box-containing protein